MVMVYVEKFVVEVLDFLVDLGFLVVGYGVGVVVDYILKIGVDVYLENVVVQGVL